MRDALEALYFALEWALDFLEPDEDNYIDNAGDEDEAEDIKEMFACIRGALEDARDYV